MPRVLRLRGSAGLLLARKCARAIVVADPARIGARHARHARVAGVLRARLLQLVRLSGVARSRHRRPSLLRTVAAVSSQRYCLARVVHLVRPNYSFKATVMCRGDSQAPRAAP